MAITLYKFGPQWGIDDPSPFCLKLESYLKLAGISYTAPPFNISMFKKSPKGKFPFVALDNGQLMGDSGLIIDHLIAGGAHDPDAPLLAEQKAVSLAFRRLLEENLYWVLIYSRWKDEPGWSVFKELFFGDVPAPLKGFVQKSQQKKVWGKAIAHGIGRHAHEEIYRIGEQDIQALSDFLGDKTYFFGTEQPAMLDLTVYAFTANILKPRIENPLKAAVQSRKNLVTHCERMHSLLAPQTGD